MNLLAIRTSFQYYKNYKLKLLLKNSLCLLLFLYLSLHSGTAQMRYQQPHQNYFRAYAHPINTNWSVAIAGGVAIYTGELSNLGDGDLQHGYGNFSWGMDIDYRLTQFLKLSAKFRGFALASDSEPEFWNNRSFTSKNRQYTLSLEHNVFPHHQIESSSKKVNFYLSAGVGFNRFRTTVDDPPLESGVVFQESTLVVPIGAGVAYYLNPNTSIRFQGHFYHSSSDLLDGTTLGQGPNDGYLILELQYHWQIANGFVYKNYLRHVR